MGPAFRRRRVRQRVRAVVAVNDDIFGSDSYRPPLATVTGQVEDAGRTLIDLLLGIANRPNPQITVPTRLRIRDSTGPCRSG